MVLSGMEHRLNDYEEIQSRDSPGSDLVERLREVEDAILNMDDQEQIYYRKRSLPNIREINTNHVAPKRPQTPPDNASLTIMDPTVPFTSRNSAISKTYTSPRQFTLSATHMGREQSAQTDNKCASRTISRATSNSMDYDEYEEIPLEQLKFHKPERTRVFRTEDIYRRACRRCRVTPSQAYLKQISTTRTIHMANTSLSHRTLKPIAISLVRDDIIHTLDISGNDVGSLGIIYVSEMLAHNSTIFELNLSNTNPRREGLEALATALETNKSLTVLRLESNYLDHRETEFIVRMMQCAPSLSEIYLGHNDLGYESAKMLAGELAVNRSVRLLDLQWNHFRKESGKQLCKALKDNTGLRSLNVSWNGLGKEGCIALATALPKNQTLKELDLTNNRIDIVSLPFLLHGLVRNKALLTLKLAKNPLTTEGVKAVVRAITGAKTMVIQYLNTEDIPVDREFTALVKKMQQDRNIRVEHGVEMYSAVELTIKEHDPHDLNRFDPVMVLIEYMRIDNLRLIDLFQFFDTTGRGLVSRENLRNGVATLGLPLTEHHLDCIMKDIDKKRDGYIDLEEFMVAQRDMSKVIIQRTTKAKGKGKEDLGLKELRKILKELVEKRNQRNKEKAAKKMNSLNAFSGAVTKVKAMVDQAKQETAKTNEATEQAAIEREDTFLLEPLKTNPGKGPMAGRRDSSLSAIVDHYTALQKLNENGAESAAFGESARGSPRLGVDSNAFGPTPEIQLPELGNMVSSVTPGLDTPRPGAPIKQVNKKPNYFTEQWPINEEISEEQEGVFVHEGSKPAWPTPRLS